jgi:hypothetical protein
MGRLSVGIIIGLPYNEMLKYFEVDELDELIDNGDLDIGSINYDSIRQENIVGVWAVRSYSSLVLDMNALEEKCRTTEILIPQLRHAELKTYLTLNIT